MIKKENIIITEKPWENNEVRVTARLRLEWSIHLCNPDIYGDRGDVIERAKQEAVAKLREEIYGEVRQKARELTYEIKLLKGSYDSKIGELLSFLLNVGNDLE
jgi:hypothetical protein